MARPKAAKTASRPRPAKKSPKTVAASESTEQSTRAPAKAAATVGQGHVAEWPDKLVFASLLLMVAGAIGLLHGLLAGLITIDTTKLPTFLVEYPVWVVLAGSAVALVCGFLGFRFQWGAPCWLGVLAAGASMGALGVVPALAVLAVVMLVLSLVEGEHVGFHRYVPAHEWPDKAIMSSLFLTVGGIFTAAQAVAQYMGSFPPFLFTDMPWVWATFSAVAALVMLAGAYQCFHLRGGRLGLAGAILGILAAAFYIFGPIFGILALLFIRLAYREAEFTGPAATA